MKKILIISLLLFSTFMFALEQTNFIPNDGILSVEERTPGTMDITVRTTTHNGQYAPRHCFALWITTDTDTFVKTVERKALSYMQHLVKFMQMTGGNSVGAVTGASLNYHTTHNLTWDGTNYNGVEVPDGIYRIYIEFTESNSASGSIPDGPWTMLEFEKGTESYQISSDVDTYFHDFSIDYSALVPVSLTNFSAERVDDYIRINWQAEENNMAGYELYRNTNNDFDTATRLTSNLIPAMNMAVPSNYNFNDTEVVAGNTYYYWVSGMTMDASGYNFGPIDILFDPVSNSENVNTPTINDISNYPNPFNPETTISFNLQKADKVVVKVYNNRGQLVRTIADQYFSQGKNNIVFNADNLSSGIYYYSVQSGSEMYWNNMVLVK